MEPEHPDEERDEPADLAAFQQDRTAVTLPPGWPERVDPPGSAGFAESASKWLYDQAPGEWRGYHVLQQHPLMLARDVHFAIEGMVEGLRRAYARARVDLADHFEPHQIEAKLKAYAEEGARLNSVARQVQLVEDALSGVRWKPRL